MICSFDEIEGGLMEWMRSLLRYNVRTNFLHLCSHTSSESSPSLIIVCPKLISYLSTTLSSTVLSSLPEAGIPVCSNESIIQSGSVDISHGVPRILPGVIFHEAKSTRHSCLLIQSDNDSL